MGISRLWIAFVATLCSTVATAAPSATQDYLQLKARIERQVAARKFTAITRQAEQAQAAHARWADGSWVQRFIYLEFREALSRQIRDDKGWSQVESQLAGLARGRPQGWLLYAEALNAHAWQVRGDKLAAEVDPDAWPTFNRLTATQEQALDDHKKALAGNPAWYAMRLRVAMESGASPAAQTQIFSEGVGRYPAYPDIYYARWQSASPMWQGSVATQRAVLDDLSRSPAGVGPDGLFVRLIWHTENSAYSLMHDKRVDEEVLRRAARAMATAYPDQYNLQKLFRTACERSDKVLTTELLGRLQNPVQPQAWNGDPPMFEMCRDWTLGKLKVFLIREHSGDQVKEILVE
jgi:hypothetical protein